VPERLQYPPSRQLVTAFEALGVDFEYAKYWGRRFAMSSSSRADPDLLQLIAAWVSDGQLSLADLG